MKMQKGFLSTNLLWAFILFAGAVHAAEENKLVTSIGLGFSSSAKYSGSDERTTDPSAHINIQYGQYFLDSDEGIGFNLNWDNGLYYTQSLGYSSGRVDKDSDSREGSDKLRGMGKIKDVAFSSSTIGWLYNDMFMVEGNVTAPLTDSQGVSYSAGVKYRIWADAKDTVVFSTNANFGDARYNNTFYGVSAQQSEKTKFRKYKPGSGLYSVDTALTWTHLFSDNWWTYAQASYTHLDKNVSKSDIVFQDNQTEYLVGLFYSF